MGVRRGRSFNQDFKLRAVWLVLAENRSVNDVASELGVLPKLIYDWVQKFQTDPDEAFPSKGKLPPTDDRLRALERENAQLRAEKAILKKALFIFSDPNVQS